MRKALPLRIALVANALFSATTGTVLCLESAHVAEHLRAVPPPLLVGIGFSLLVFAFIVALVARRPSPANGLIISALDIGWVAITVPLALFWDALAPAGAQTVLWVAAIVGSLAALQMFSVRLMMRSTEPERGIYRHCVRVHADAPADSMWEIVSDLGAIATFSPGLVSSTLEDGTEPKAGAIRTCRNPEGQVWSEACEVFDADRRIVEFRFMSERDGFPYPARVMYGGWRIDPDDEGCMVELWWTLTPTVSPGWLIVALMGLKVDRDMADLISRMVEAANGRPVPESPPRISYAFC